LHQGLYAISPTVPGITPVHEFEIAMALVEPAAIAYWSALHHHALTEQAPRKIFVLTTTEASVPVTRIHDSFQIENTEYQFVKVKPERFFGTEKIWVGETRVTITDLERTLIDALSMPQYCGDFAEVMHAFGVSRERLNLERIIKYALKLDAATAKRLGWILESLGTPRDRLESLAQAPIKGYRTLDASGPRKGPRHRYWMIQENLSGLVHQSSKSEGGKVTV
jgi:predicted transcriptional regulator of viral defense system